VTTNESETLESLYQHVATATECVHDKIFATKCYRV